MIAKKDQVRLRKLLRESIRLLCKNGLAKDSAFQVEAMIGITLRSDVLLFSFKDQVCPDGSVVSHMWSDEEEEETKTCGNSVEELCDNDTTSSNLMQSFRNDIRCKRPQRWSRQEKRLRKEQRSNLYNSGSASHMGSHGFHLHNDFGNSAVNASAEHDDSYFGNMQLQSAAAVRFADVVGDSEWSSGKAADLNSKAGENSVQELSDNDTYSTSLMQSVRNDKRYKRTWCGLRQQKRLRKEQRSKLYSSGSASHVGSHGFHLLHNGMDMPAINTSAEHDDNYCDNVQLQAAATVRFPDVDSGTEWSSGKAAVLGSVKSEATSSHKSDVVTVKVEDNEEQTGTSDNNEFMQQMDPQQSWSFSNPQETGAGRYVETSTALDGRTFSSDTQSDQDVTKEDVLKLATVWSLCKTVGKQTSSVSGLAPGDSAQRKLCTICGDSFKWRMQLHRHRQRFHPELLAGDRENKFTTPDSQFMFPPSLKSDCEVFCSGVQELESLSVRAGFTDNN